MATSRRALLQAEEARVHQVAELQAAKQRAEEEQQRAAASAQRARDQLRIAATLDAPTDPTKRAAILRELERPDETLRLRLKLPFEALQEPLALYVHQGDSVFSPDGTLLVSRAEYSVQIKRVDDSAAPIVLPVRSDEQRQACFFPDGSRVVTVDMHGVVRVFSCDGSAAVQLPLIGTAVLAIAQAGDQLVSVTTDGIVQVVRTDGFGAPVTLLAQAGIGPCTVFSPDGTHIVCFSEDAPPQVHCADGGGAKVVLAGHHGAVKSAAYSSDGSRIVTGAADGTARIFCADGTGEPITLDVCFRSMKGNSLGGSRMLQSSDPNAVNAVYEACFSPDDTCILTASSDSLIRIWRADGSGEPTVLRGHQAAVVKACYSPDGSRVASYAWDGTVRVWNADGSGTPKSIVVGDDTMVSVAFSTDGKSLLVATAGGPARVYPLTMPDVLRVFPAGQSSHASAAFSNDGSCVVTLSVAGLARLWHLRGNQSTGTFGSSAKTTSPLSSAPSACATKRAPATSRFCLRASRKASISELTPIPRQNHLFLWLTGREDKLIRHSFCVQGRCLLIRKSSIYRDYGSVT